ncbi:LRR domain containing protein [Parasponia andersonii]|uniref:LRR domain containing protein n=1 Tax=Parasponia andersonii TaxID=3476 RepID=A0A2P5E5G8_PARAD|nr:LRR domain containing protein [Parasponia andersonii]
MISFIFTRFIYFLLYIHLLPTLLCFSLSQPLCHDEERSSLLQFKESFIINKSESVSDDPPKVKFWTHESQSSNCCSWGGVECDEDTGHVISLDLSSSFLYGSIDSNSSLFKLVHLQRLNLADNHFNYSHIPIAIKHLSMLTSLNLSDSAFSGQIPSEISTLSKLSSLSLSHNRLELKGPNFETLITNLTGLEQLHLSQVDISSTVPKSLANLTSLTSLLLRDCGLKGEFPGDIFQLPNLQILNVQLNEDLSGKLPPLLKQSSSLKVLRVAHTSFFGELPSFIEKLTSLKELNASGCNLSGMIPTSIGKLNQLAYLDLSENNFWGKIPLSLANLTQLIELYLDSNHFSGPIPLSFSKLINLEILYLRNNYLSGTVNFDMFIGLKNLTAMDLSNNKISPLIESSMNETFPQFTSLKLSNCSLRKWPDFLRHQSRMEVLNLNGNHIGGRIPEWMWNISRETLFTFSLSENSLIGEVSPTICNLSSLEVLLLSHNKLSGKLPQCLGSFSKSVSILDLSDNAFSGNIPTFTEGNQLKIIDLGHNQLQGILSQSLTNCKMLGYLNLESNKLNDVFPYWLGTLPELEILVLKSNTFHGVIEEPMTNLDFPKLRIIDASYNNFSGKLPLKYMQSWKAMGSRSVGEFEYMLSIPFKHVERGGGQVWQMHYYYTITIAIKGADRHYKELPNLIAIINLCNNNFDGEIPEVIGNLLGLYSIDLSNNNLAGSIPSSLGNLTELESLDLSQNELSGEIPRELAQLTFLQYFNVSHNHLTGPIPQENQLSRFESSSYEGNLGLCGIPVPNKCGDSEALEPVPLSSSEEEQEESTSPFNFGWKVVVIGYGCGFVFGFLIGQIVLARKPNWFAILLGSGIRRQ